MGIFLLSIVAGAIIGKCFFKKNFWENRYIVLLFIIGIAFISILTTNYVVRSNTPIITEVIKEKELDVFYLDDSLFVDDTPLVFDDDWSFTSNKDNPYPLLMTEYSVYIDTATSDTIKTQRKSTNLMFYYMENNDDIWKLGYIHNNSRGYSYWDYAYIISNNNDTIPASIKTIRQVYDKTAMNSRWVTPFSIPRIKQIKVFAIPPTQYAAIPDSLIRELPFKLN